MAFYYLPDLVSNVTTNTATIWSFSSHWSLTNRPGNGRARSLPRGCPQSTVCGRPEPPSPPATTAVPHLAGVQVMAVDLLLHPVPAKASVAARRPDACELFFRGGASSSRGREAGGGCAGGGHAWFGSGGGISSQSSSGARSDCFTIMLLLLLRLRLLLLLLPLVASQTVGRRDNSPLLARIDVTKHGAGAGSWFPAARRLFSMYW